MQHHQSVKGREPRKEKEERQGKKEKNASGRVKGSEGRLPILESQGKRVSGREGRDLRRRAKRIFRSE
jgi:hypothetical protein